LSSASAVDAPKCGKAGQISTILAEESANIVDMLNKSRDEVAYTLVDIEGRVSDTVVNNLKEVA
jgi:D-3-phosphoglycerate dehydrogenase